MADADTRVKFVSQKISKIRWKPRSNRELRESEVFASGSWDDEDTKVCLWKMPDSGDGMGEESQSEGEPRLLCEAPHKGDVTDLIFTDENHIITSSSTGSVTMYSHFTNSQTLGISQKWENLHSHLGDRECSCTCLASRGDDMVVTSGEDGRVNVLNLGQRHPVRKIEKADSCTVNSITFLEHLEIITVNSTGQLKVFDLRQPSDEPSRTFLLTGEHTPLQCVNKHPTQPNIVATGTDSGMLCIWDLRQDKFPITSCEAHSAAMWEVKFHPSHPDHLFTCSEDGSAFHWDVSAVNQTHMGASLLAGTGAGSGGGGMFSAQFPGGASASAHVNPWLSLNVSSHKIEMANLLPNHYLPVNTIDIEGQTLLCGTDAEAIYTIDMPGIR